MWQAIFALFKTPSLWGHAILAAAFVVFVYPFVLLLMYISYLICFLKEKDVRITETGLTVFTRLRGELATYPWAEIQQMRVWSKPPITYPEITLVSGATIHLECAGYKELAAVLQERGVAVDLEPRMPGA